MSTTWRFQYLGEEYGPITFRELVGMVREGVVAEGDRVRASWMIDWQRAEDVVGLFRMARLSPEELERFYSPLLEADKGLTLDPEERKEWWERFETARLMGTDEPVEDRSGVGGRLAGVVDAVGEDAGVEAGDVSVEEVELVEGEGEAGNDVGGGAGDSGLAAAIDSAMEQAEPAVSPPRTGVWGAVVRAASAISRFSQRNPNLVAQLYRVVCAIAVTSVVLSLLEGWSERESLRFPGREGYMRGPNGEIVAPAKALTLPVLGKCEPTTYYVVMAHVWLICWGGTYFAAGRLTALTEQS
jgi:hypothetical protein